MKEASEEEDIDAKKGKGKGKGEDKILLDNIVITPQSSPR